MQNHEDLTRFFHPVLSERQLGKNPQQVQIGSEQIVLYRDQQNKIVALKDRCPHRFTPLSQGKVNKAGRITCPYHGWNFNDKGEGLKPAQGSDTKPSCRVPAYQVITKYGYIWVGNQNANPAEVENQFEKGWTFVGSYSLTFDAPFHVAIDNFSEDEHFPFVHKIFGWDESGVKDVEFNCHQEDDKVYVHYWGPQRTFWGMRLLLARPGQYLDNRWVASYDPVRILYTSHLTDKNKKHESPGHNHIAIYFVPRGEDKTDLHAFQFVKFRNPLWYRFLPLFRPMYVRLFKNDLAQDAHFVKKLKNVPYSFQGMGLGTYDKPLIYGRKLLDKVYYRRTPQNAEAATALHAQDIEEA